MLGSSQHFEFQASLRRDFTRNDYQNGLWRPLASYLNISKN